MTLPPSRINLKSKNTELLTSGQVYQYALRLLTGRDYSVAGIRRKLAAREVATQDLDDAILRLQREGLLDDARYAERFAESALSSGRFYGARLRLEMRRRGFDAALVSTVLETIIFPSDEVADIAALVERRFHQFSFTSAAERDRRRVISFLLRRGFGISAVMRALRESQPSGD